MKKTKFKKGDKLYWHSVIYGAVLGGVVTKINHYNHGNTYDIDCGSKNGRWEVAEEKLTKRKNPTYVESKANKILHTMGVKR